MNILTTRKLRFSVDGLTFVSAGGGNIEFAPDWIAHSDMFAAAKGSSFLTIIGDVPLISVPQAPAEPGPAEGDSDPGEDDGTFDVKSLAGKLQATIGATRDLLKSKYSVETQNGSTVLDQAVFEKVQADQQPADGNGQAA